MSLKQFETFYWPTLKDVMLQLIAKGFICRSFAEGDWGPNMKYWREIPKGKIVLKIDRADMFKAKELVGDKICLQGNVPPSLLEFGTPRQVQNYCKKLIDIVGEGGGYIMDSAMSIDRGAKIENVIAMIRFTTKYGVYRR
jgi:uroporphyrinogen-III decarboxylase